MLNWLALAGWGVDHTVPAEQHEHKHEHGQPPRAPDSTSVFTVPSMIQQARHPLFLSSDEIQC